MWVGNAMMLEADISLQGHRAGKSSDVPFMKNRGLTLTSNLTLAQWMDMILNSDKGIKLDFKSNEVVAPVLRILQERRTELRRPIWLSADILRGPNALYDPINATYFLRSIDSMFPEVTLSLGWTSGWSSDGENEQYSWEMVERMEKIARKMRQPITFAVRAVCIIISFLF